MAGGMRRGSTWGSLEERGRATRGEPPQPPEPLALPPGAEAWRHCWVRCGDGTATYDVPGLLLAWRQAPEGWEGRVVRPAPGVDGWLVLEDWLPAARLRPLEG